MINPRHSIIVIPISIIFLAASALLTYRYMPTLKRASTSQAKVTTDQESPVKYHATYKKRDKIRAAAQQFASRSYTHGDNDCKFTLFWNGSINGGYIRAAVQQNGQELKGLFNREYNQYYAAPPEVWGFSVDSNGRVQISYMHNRSGKSQEFYLVDSKIDTDAVFDAIEEYAYCNGKNIDRLCRTPPLEC